MTRDEAADFCEDDEPLEDILAAFEGGVDGFTGPPKWSAPDARDACLEYARSIIAHPAATRGERIYAAGVAITGYVAAATLTETKERVAHIIDIAPADYQLRQGLRKGLEVMTSGRRPTT